MGGVLAEKQEFMKQAALQREVEMEKILEEKLLNKEIVILLARKDLVCIFCKKEPTTVNKRSGEILPCRKCKNKRITLYKYNLTLKDFAGMLSRQNFKCAICEAEFSYDSKSTSPNVDHCHDLGHVRGVLCGRCNTGLGMFLDDDYILEKAIKYLKTTRVLRQ